jgi:hypothetical protein
MLFMGIDAQLPYQSYAVPSASLARLSRDDAARFGLDRREFGETVWRFVDKPTPTIRKVFFVRTRSEQPHFIDGLVDLSCGKRPGVQYVLTFARDLLPAEPSAPSAQASVGIRVSDKQFSLSREQDPRLYLRSTQLALAALDGVTDAATIALPGTEFGGGEGPAGDVTLTMNGFSAAYAKLQQTCAQP